MKIKDLIDAGRLEISVMTKYNPRQWEDREWYINLVGHDYPGKSPTLCNSVYERFGWPFRSAILVGNPEMSRYFFEVFKKDSSFLGGGVGIGFKNEVVKQQALDRLDVSAERIRAVNVVVRSSGKLVGYNTDGLGYLKSLEEKCLSLGKDLSKSTVLLLGAGGAASALAFTISSKVKSIIVVNRTVERAQKLAERINRSLKREIVSVENEDNLGVMAAKSHVIINATTKGASGELNSFCALSTTSSLEQNIANSELILRGLERGTLISDINLTVGDTVTLTLAKKHNLPTLDGHSMVVFQAIEAFYLVHADLLRKKGIEKGVVAGIMQGVDL